MEESFSGSLNGNGYEIRNLYINRSEENLVGLFGYISTEGLVSNLKIVNADVEGLDYVGILAGIAYGTIEDSSTTGSVFGDDDVGGMIGSHLGFDTITNSYSEATVVGDSRVGGLVGRNHGNIYDSYATGDVSGNSEVGGLVGESSANPESTGIYTQIEILNSYATGDVFARDFDFENLDYYQLDDEYYESFGGLVGTINGTLIEDSYATGDVIGYEDIGGLVGTSGLFEYYNSEMEETAFIASIIRDSYATGNVHGTETVGGLVGDVYATEISGSYATGNVFGEVLSLYIDEEFYEQEFSDSVGGFVGEIDSRTDSIYNEETETSSLIKVVEAIISESYAYGNVEGNYRVGGFVGINTSGKIENAYARGSVTAINEEPESIGGFVGTMLVDEGAEMIHVYSTGEVTSEIEIPYPLGGLVGYIDIDDNITTSFWDTQVSGLTISGGGTGKTTAQMKTEATFTSAGWDFDDVWDIDSNSNDGYPMLKDHIGDQDGIDGYQAPEEDIDPEPQPRRRVIGSIASPSYLAKHGIVLADKNESATQQSNNNQCPADQLLTQNLRSGARNGRFHPYTRAIVTEAKILQAHLNRLGFNSGPVDGILGPISDGAIKRMQTFLGTKPDGFVGPITRGLLNNSCGVDGLQN